ncbi:CoA-transferase family III [Pluteus cervinus]|uniref:CoA-transferase family III n=1 Tax=Pluteus cervinus TaxID=181527 RepID=A0ACD3AUU4_9AGAR|nr:CoA-transferase family III [Pluteus cervinus]
METKQPTGLESARNLWLNNGLPEDQLSHLKFTGSPESAVNSTFRLGVAAQASVGLSGLSAAYFHALRSGTEQDVTVDARHAVLTFHSEAYYTVNDTLPGGGRGIWDTIAGLYKTKDGYARIHTNFPHHRRGILAILGIPDSPNITRNKVADALEQWNSVDLETVAASKGVCATALRSFAEWDEHPQAQALLGTPPVVLKKIGEAPKRGPGISGQPARPLDGIRVLDLCRVLAGPVCGRTLAAHGADVLLVTSPELPGLPLVDPETSLGKRTTQLNLLKEEDRATLMELVKDSNVFLQAYRPGGLAKKGFDAETLASIRPGIVYASLTAWGWDGPWKDRKGFDSLVQTATGFNHAEGEAYQAYQKASAPDTAYQPRIFPVQAIDHAAGYLLAFGINAALCKTVTEGGSWEVQVSLAAVGQWIRSLGRLTPQQGFAEGNPLPGMKFPVPTEILELSETWREDVLVGAEEERKRLTALKHPAILHATPVRGGATSSAPLTLNKHDAKWLRN